MGDVVPIPRGRDICRDLAMRRAAIFFFYDERGQVDDYIIYLLGKLRPFVETIIFVSNGAISKSSEASLRSTVDETIIRENTGFDVGAYRQGLEFVGFDKLGDYD